MVSYLLSADRPQNVTATRPGAVPQCMRLRHTVPVPTELITFKVNLETARCSREIHLSAAISEDRSDSAQVSAAG